MIIDIINDCKMFSIFYYFSVMIRNFQTEFFAVCSEKFFIFFFK